MTAVIFESHFVGKPDACEGVDADVLVSLESECGVEWDAAVFADALGGRGVVFVEAETQTLVVSGKGHLPLITDAPQDGKPGT